MDTPRVPGNTPVFVTSNVRMTEPNHAQVDFVYDLWNSAFWLNPLASLLWGLQDVLVTSTILFGYLRLRSIHEQMVVCSIEMPDFTARLTQDSDRHDRHLQTDMIMQLKFREEVVFDQNQSYVRISLLGYDTRDLGAIALLFCYLLYTARSIKIADSWGRVV